jgi:hypothetical protein
MRRAAFRTRAPPAQAPPSSRDGDDRRLRPLIIAVLALPLPSGAARRIAQVVVEEIIGGGATRGQLQPIRALRAELEGVSVAEL